MIRKDAREKLEWLSNVAGMNQRYHQYYAGSWRFWNRAMQISVGILAVVGVCLSVTTALVHSGGADAVAIVFSSLAALAAIALNVVPISDWALVHLDLFARWSDLRQDVDTLQQKIVDGPDDVAQYYVERIQELYAKKNGLNSQEPTQNRKFLETCEEDENESRWGVRTQEERDAQRALAEAKAIRERGAHAAAAH